MWCNYNLVHDGMWEGFGMSRPTVAGSDCDIVGRAFGRTVVSRGRRVLHHLKVQMDCCYMSLTDAQTRWHKCGHGKLC